jgi:broad specificity polyphosphatase/5'/3'-nucleotidase SurE
VAQRTALVNQTRGLLAEYGLVVATGRTTLRCALPTLLEDASNGLSFDFRQLLAELYDELVALDARVEQLTRRIEQQVKQHPDAQRLLQIPGIGPLTASALITSVGNATQFRNGRQLAAFLGLVPRQHSSAGKARLLGIHKRGDSYLRGLLVHGARSVLRTATNKPDDRSRWLMNLSVRRHRNIATVAQANKTVRIVWAVLDIVVSGINTVANLGDDVIYSGTVAAAMEGRFLGLPSVAMSLVSHGHHGQHYESAARAAVAIIDRLRSDPLPASTILNVNVPDLPWDQIRGFETSRLGQRHRAEPCQPQQDPRGRQWWWIGAAGDEQDAGPGTDFHAVRSGYVAITPIHVDLTRYQALEQVAGWVGGLSASLETPA